MFPGRKPGPDWDRLFEVAAGQSGYFTTTKAAEAGYSTHLLRKHSHAGRVLRAQRRIYRLVHFPAADHEQLVTAWLWSEQAGVIWHQTALSLHGLSDVLPAQVHLTLPEAWRRRRFRGPAGVVLHHADVAPAQRAWFGAAGGDDGGETRDRNHGERGARSGAHLTPTSIGSVRRRASGGKAAGC